MERKPNIAKQKSKNIDNTNPYKKVYNSYRKSDNKNRGSETTLNAGYQKATITTETKNHKKHILKSIKKRNVSEKIVLNSLSKQTSNRKRKSSIELPTGFG